MLQVLKQSFCTATACNSHAARINCQATMQYAHWTQTARPHSQPCLHRVGKAALLCAIPLRRLKPARVTTQVSGGSFKVGDFERKNDNKGFGPLKGFESTYCVQEQEKTNFCSLQHSAVFSHHCHLTVEMCANFVVPLVCHSVHL